MSAFTSKEATFTSKEVLREKCIIEFILFSILMKQFLFFPEFVYSVLKITTIQRVRYFVGHEMINLVIIHVVIKEIKYVLLVGKEQIVT